MGHVVYLLMVYVKNSSITFMFRDGVDTRSIQYARFVSRDTAYSNIEKVWMAYAEQFLPGIIHHLNRWSCASVGYYCFCIMLIFVCCVVLLCVICFRIMVTQVRYRIQHHGHGIWLQDLN